MYVINGYVSWNYCNSLCLHFTFLWRRRCMLWIDFCADNKRNGNKENECFRLTLCVTLWYNDTLTVLEREHNLPLRVFPSLNLHDRDNNEEYTNTRTTGWAKAPVRNSKYIFNCCVGGTIARAILCLQFTFGGACYTYRLVTVLSLNGCVDCTNCTCDLLPSLDEYHHACMAIVPCVFIKSIHRQSW